MTIAIYGIRNCDTIKKARAWLDGHDVPYTFHDYKQEGVEPARLQRWIDAVGWETLLNKAGTTFRGLPHTDKADVDADKAAVLMQAHPSLVKRPVLEHAGGLLVGFKPDIYAAALA